jgi:hypothetical protein
MCQMYCQQRTVKKFQKLVAVESSIRQVGLVSKCEVPFLAETVKLSPLYESEFC